jgi:hypothetical protein
VEAAAGAAAGAIQKVLSSGQAGRQAGVSSTFRALARHCSLQELAMAALQAADIICLPRVPACLPTPLASLAPCLQVPVDLSSHWRPVRSDGLPAIFTGGWVGYTGYDTVRYVYSGGCAMLCMLCCAVQVFHCISCIHNIGRQLFSLLHAPPCVPLLQVPSCPCPPVSPACLCRQAAL